MLEYEKLISDILRNISIVHNIGNTHLQSVLPGNMLHSHYAVLSFLINNDDVKNPALLADIFHVKRSSMTNTLNKLDAMNFISMAKDSKDGRKKTILVTKQGRKVKKQADLILAEVYKKAADQLGIDLIRDVSPKLRTIRDFVTETYRYKSSDS